MGVLHGDVCSCSECFAGLEVQMALPAGEGIQEWPGVSAVAAPWTGASVFLAVGME